MKNYLYKAINEFKVNKFSLLLTKIYNILNF